jgi:hypothetical protein
VRAPAVFGEFCVRLTTVKQLPLRCDMVARNSAYKNWRRIMLADEFAKAFREEHREIRDTLFALSKAFEQRDKNRINEMLGKTAALTGPHFRYEEEALYPSLIEIFGDAYIEKLLEDHDRAIAGANALVQLAQKDRLTSEDSQRATELVRTILPHVSDCEGLSIMAETLPEQRIRNILAARDACQREGLDLIEWATKVRRRPAVSQ